MKVTLRQARVLSDMTQKQAAEKLNVHPHTYMKWEKNPDTMPVGKAKEVSNIFSRNVDEIFFNHDSTLSRQTV